MPDGSAGGPPVPDLFVREDVAKPENRVNLALFSLMLVPTFRRWFLERLRLDPEAYTYPPQNQPGGRPDFVVVAPDGSVLAWIEVELGGENSARLSAYRAALSKPIRSVIGVEGYGGDLSLQEIAATVTDMLDELDLQQAMNAGVLVQLIAELAHPPQAAQYIEPGDVTRTDPLIAALDQRLPGRLVFGVPPVRPGTVHVGSMSQRGWTIRVYSTIARGHSVQLMNKPTSAISVRVPARDHLNRYLPLAPQAVDRYSNLMLKLGLDIGKLGPNEHLPVSEELLLSDVDELVNCMRELAMAYGGVQGTDDGASTPQ
jgi:hypothetical protein